MATMSCADSPRSRYVLQPFLSYRWAYRSIGTDDSISILPRMHQQCFSMAALSLIALTLHTTTMTIFMRISTEQSDYISTVAVAMDELIKLLFSVIMVLVFYVRSPAEHPSVAPSRDGAEASIIGFGQFFRAEVFASLAGFMAMAVPAVCYAVGKNLSFYAISCVSPAMYQILFQGKLLTTAGFSYLILHKHFTFRQKVSLGVLCVGVALTEVSSLDEPHNAAVLGTQHGNQTLRGSLAILIACFLSGYSAVYIEKSIKASDSPDDLKPYTIWVRNIQLSTFGVAASIAGLVFEDSTALETNGIFQGFTPLVWVVVFLSSFGGILIALVMKYADNILKNFATSVAIITTSAFSSVFFDLTLTPTFIAGALLVLAAVHLYSSGAVSDQADTGGCRLPDHEFDILSPMCRPMSPRE